MRPTLTLFCLLCAAPLLAEDYGTLNPEEMTWGSNIAKLERGEITMPLCASGYMMTKSGDHDTARKIFEACAAAGYTGTMTWMSYMENNGFGGDYNPDAAADWDRLAAERGDPVGLFNHGLNLLRGHGIARDEAEGKRMVETAAEAGLDIAQALIAAEWDLDAVTPDADNWRYAPSF
ncbi:tetratricopeptide repeat protein [Thetidibacter halocola]|uniref:Sel1 repeat family protein n=1 Tax=Thetidibacter halocola TaxID=2827239 RepID=A0A8J7W8D5_9RHOB|nr:sel1 repeat family protein [Thetidibacter halocola]MBS0122845.1 sel1 repeat family protein [Thetidibacter halocola]